MILDLNGLMIVKRPFPSYPKPLFQSEAKCEAIDIKMFFYSHSNKRHFHKKGVELSLVFRNGQNSIEYTY